MTRAAHVPRNLQAWFDAVRASHRVYLNEQARIRAVKRSRPMSAFEARFYQMAASTMGILIALLVLGASR